MTRRRTHAAADDPGSQHRDTAAAHVATSREVWRRPDSRRVKRETYGHRTLTIYPQAPRAAVRPAHLGAAEPARSKTNAMVTTRFVLTPPPASSRPHTSIPSPPWGSFIRGRDESLRHTAHSQALLDRSPELVFSRCSWRLSEFGELLAKKQWLRPLQNGPTPAQSTPPCGQGTTPPPQPRSPLQSILVSVCQQSTAVVAD